MRAQKGSIFTFCQFFWVHRCKRCHSKIGNVRLVFKSGNTSCKTFKYTKWFITSNFPQRDRKMGPKKGNELPLAMDCYRRWQRCLFRDQERSDRQGSGLKKKGVRNIDVGCMQINLFYHPNAFDNLDQAFDPLTNTRYAADFLTNLYKNNGSWNLAIERYHSGNTTRGTKYRKAVIHLKEQAAKGLSKRLASPHFLKLADNTSVIHQPKTIDLPRPYSQKSDFYKRREQKNLELRKAFLERKAKVMKRWKDMMQKRKTSDGAPGKRQSS